MLCWNRASDLSHCSFLFIFGTLFLGGSFLFFRKLRWVPEREQSWQQSCRSETEQRNARANVVGTVGLEVAPIGRSIAVSWVYLVSWKCWSSLESFLVDFINLEDSSYQHWSLISLSTVESRAGGSPQPHFSSGGGFTGSPALQSHSPWPRPAPQLLLKAQQWAQVSGSFPNYFLHLA